jgi:hypothetical protein
MVPCRRFCDVFDIRLMIDDRRKPPGPPDIPFCPLRADVQRASIRLPRICMCANAGVFNRVRLII